MVLDAIRAVIGDYTAQETDFNEKKQNIEIAMTIDITEEDLHQFHAHGSVSLYKSYDLWKRDFVEKLPSFLRGKLSFVCSIDRNGQIRYEDGFHKNNRYIREVLPKLHFIDTTRNVATFQEYLLVFQRSEELMQLRSNTCMLILQRLAIIVLAVSV